MMPQVEALSGFNQKAPAAIRVEWQGKRLLLDAGGELNPDVPCRWADGLDVDAVLISHDHIDHIGGVALLPADVPLYCTPQVAQALPPGRAWRPLLPRGLQQILGIPVTTGQAGHSLGGVWLHLGIGGGIFYSGDASLESLLFPFDKPPSAHVALLDASYGLYDCPQEECRQALCRHLDRPTVMPVPASGRALEMALWLHRQAGRQGIEWSLDGDCRKGLEQLLSLPQALRHHGNDTDLRQLLAISEPASPRIRLVGDRDDSPRDWPSYRLLHTGYLTPERQRQLEAGEVDWMRWNVHLRFSHLLALVHHLGAQQVIPMFTRLVPEWSRLLAMPLTSSLCEDNPENAACPTLRVHAPW
jgi:glyoxylase-like metal-dependent hydrolase (beta-lactamase superfamily II)